MRIPELCKLITILYNKENFLCANIRIATKEYSISKKRELNETILQNQAI